MGQMLLWGSRKTGWQRLAFGLCDLGLGEPELGYVTLHELAAARGPLGLPLERVRRVLRFAEKRAPDAGAPAKAEGS